MLFSILFRSRFVSLWVFFALLAQGCIPYKQCDRICSSHEVEPSPEVVQAHNHWLYGVVPRHRSIIRWYDLPHWCTWAIFGNDDDGMFGEEITANYHTRRKVGCMRAAMWGIRNPLHNICFYVIGSAQFQNSQVTVLQVANDNTQAFKYYEKAHTVFPEEHKSCFFFALNGWKPFLSIRMFPTKKFQSDFYIGWRERGNFGLKCIPYKSPKCNDETDKQ